MSSSNASYERQDSNIDEIPVTSRRSDKELRFLEYLQLREGVDRAYQAIREKKRKIQELLNEDASLRQLDSHLRKVPRDEEDSRKQRAEKRKATTESALEEQQRKEERNRKENAIKKRKKEHKELLTKGYRMTEKEIQQEGGEKGIQYVYFKDLGEGKADTKVRRGIRGLKLSSTLGEEEEVAMES